MRYARGEAILRVIAMRYAPQLIVSQNEPILLANLFHHRQSRNFQIPPDLVVKSQAVDSTEGI